MKSRAAMIRFSLFRFVICLPLIAGIIFAIYSFRNNQILVRFNDEIDNNRLMRSVVDLPGAVGEEQARKIVELKASNNDSLVYDGKARMAQIVKCRHPYDNDNSDLCALYTFGTGCVWFGPSGMRIDSVSFNDNEILVTIHGDLRWESYSFIIPENKPETYSIPWAANTEPSNGHFANLIRVRQSNAQLEEKRFYALNDAVREDFALGKNEEAQKHAKELLNLLPKYKDNWNYGNAVHDANLVLGRIAIIEGRLDDAKQCLIESGQSPGSPQLNSFGPNMSLAKDLLEKNETDVVLQYLELCRRFWKSGGGQLDQWSRQVKAGKVPDFGANLR